MKYYDGYVSDMKVLQSAAGYYIGKEQWDDAMKCWMPYSRNSVEYFRTFAEAQEALDAGRYTTRYEAGMWTWTSLPVNG